MQNKNPLITPLEVGISSSSNKPQEKQSAEITDLYSSYNKNKLVLMAVNSHAQHFYWDIADDMITNLLISGAVKIEAKLYIIDQHKKSEIDSIEILSAKGNYYTYNDINFKSLQVVIFVTDGSGTREFLASNIITTPSSTTHSSPYEIWMTKEKIESKIETKPSEAKVAEELYPQLSSADLADRNRAELKRLGELGLTNPSSSFASDKLSKNGK